VRARTAAPSPEEARAVFAEFLEELGEGVIAAAAEGTDVLLTAFGPAPLERLVAEGFGIPSAGVYLVPGVPTREFPPPGWPVTGPLPVADHLAAGYWWPASQPGWQPPTPPVDFLAAGPAPVFVGFGSMTPSHERLQDAIAIAVRRAGVRAVVQSGWAELSPAGDDILVVDDQPHDWLFPRTAAVVHHTGAGTTGAGLRAGVPAVPVPVLVDQPFWADRLHHLGVAPPPLPLHELTVPLHELTADTLTDALRSCLDRPTYRDRATELARPVRADDGPAAVLSLLTRLEGRPGQRL
jgi:UDP:flavonoid glycosyltransferase YjiC (YdhE family)